ncbi:efflux RND transporter periplasmic adaptor subunit [Labrys wisconsinensis]|uniref:Multidrug efflux system membrane fusion protein n=1 Tax=Labrys wisconsinensis TaxID=425677 RepID=A0ABU0JH20_9HYPH|nr:efflux RND transporter periplasmic adaptor subunit [Labrys wisconsinensis]MDQ0473585.1 multidrug efflux system membrane fusion protein [Labrys wisconsinensis]
MKRLSKVVVVLLLVGGVGWWQRATLVPLVARVVPQSAPYLAAVPAFAATLRAEPAGADATAKAAPKPAPVPVTVAQVRKADFPVYLTGLGTVQAYDTVTVRSRVDGQITKVFFKQGQMVKEGDPLVEIDKRPYRAALDQAVAKKAQDEASLRDDKLNLQRYQSLAKQDFASRQQLDTQQALVDQLTAQIQGDQATIDNAQTQLDYTSIKSPLTGKTGFRLVDPGNIVHASDTNGIVTIVKLQPISVVYTAPEESIPAINKALAAGEVPVAALSSDGQSVLSRGHLALVDNAVNEASGTIGMKATFENGDNALWPGLSVSTRMRVDTLKQVVVVPEDTVQRGPNGLYAFVVGADNKVAMQTIKVSQTGTGQSVITDGLTPGQTVVVEGQYRLQPGTEVAATPMGGQAGGDKLAEASEQGAH